MRLPLALLAVASLAAASHAKTIVVDGNPADWTGTPPTLVHDVAVNGDEWIYKGEAGDLRTDAAGNLGNYDITEARITLDATNLFLLVRFADITVTNEVSLAIGFDLDQNPGDSGMNFLGDNSGTPFFSSPSFYPEYQVHFHNAQNGITWGEFFHDVGAGSWYTDGGTVDSFISTTNNLLEARISLSAIGLTPTSTFGLSIASFDNGFDDGLNPGDPSGFGFNNTGDTTVDYPVLDALDGVGGTPGTSANAYGRVISISTGLFEPGNIAPIPLPSITASRVAGWEMLE